VHLSDGTSVSTNAEGRYRLSGLAAGTYAVAVRMSGYLEARQSEVAVPAGAEITLPDVTLQAGDIDGDCEVSLFDLIAVSSGFGDAAGHPSADINADGLVDIRDLILVSTNFRAICPSEW